MNRPIPSTLSVRVPFAVRKRGGRKLVITPDGTTQRPRRASTAREVVQRVQGLKPNGKGEVAALSVWRRRERDWNPTLSGS